MIKSKIQSKSRIKRGPWRVLLFILIRILILFLILILLLIFLSSDRCLT